MTALTDVSGVVVASYYYDAFGAELSSTGDIDNPFRYAGYEFDDETGLYYLKSRFYDSSVARFTQEDPYFRTYNNPKPNIPAIMQSLNLYVYCMNNPVNFTDSSGLAYIPLRSTADGDGYGVSWNGDTLSAGVWADDYNRLGIFTVGLGEKGKAPYINSDGKMMVWDETYYSITMLTTDDKTAGVIVTHNSGIWYKDFSSPINSALGATAAVAEKKWRTDYPWFLGQVNHAKPWDIKREASWNSTIGANTYPGWGVQFVFGETLFNPEELGNYTYGYIGHALGLTIVELYGGSWVAAGFPIGGADWQNEFNDWGAITNGFNAYKKK